MKSPFIVASDTIFSLTFCNKSLKVVKAKSWREVKISPKVSIPYTGGENQRAFLGISCTGCHVAPTVRAISSCSDGGGKYNRPFLLSATTAISFVPRRLEKPSLFIYCSEATMLQHKHLN